jgi:hypothetical protein
VSFTGNKPIYALAAALGAAVIALGIIGMSAVAEMKASREFIAPTSSVQELKEIRDEISKLNNSITSNGDSTLLQNEQEKSIAVTGTASSMIEPDSLYISLGVDTKAETAQEAIRLNAEKMDKVVKAIRDLGIEGKEIRTSYFNLQPDYKYTNPPQLVGFIAANTVTISTSSSAITPGKIIDTAVGAGANRVDSAYFAVSPELSAKLWEQTVKDAVSDARLKAEKVLAPLGMKIVGVKSINPFDTGYPIFQRPTVLGDVAGAPQPLAPSTPIYPGQQQFSVSVSVTFLIA